MMSMGQQPQMSPPMGGMPPEAGAGPSFAKGSAPPPAAGGGGSSRFSTTPPPGFPGGGAGNTFSATPPDFGGGGGASFAKAGFPTMEQLAKDSKVGGSTSTVQDVEVKCLEPRGQLISNPPRFATFEETPFPATIKADLVRAGFP